jgi:hypothetical protein
LQKRSVSAENRKRGKREKKRIDYAERLKKSKENSKKRIDNVRLLKKRIEYQNM